MSLSFCRIFRCAGYSRSTLCTSPPCFAPGRLTCIGILTSGFWLEVGQWKVTCRRLQTGRQTRMYFSSPPSAGLWVGSPSQDSCSSLPLHTHPLWVSFNPACPLLVISSLDVLWLRESDWQPRTLTHTELGSPQELLGFPMRVPRAVPWNWFVVHHWKTLQACFFEVSQLMAQSQPPRDHTSSCWREWPSKPCLLPLPLLCLQAWWICFQSETYSSTQFNSGKCQG